VIYENRSLNTDFDAASLRQTLSKWSSFRDSCEEIYTRKIWCKNILALRKYCVGIYFLWITRYI